MAKKKKTKKAVKKVIKKVKKAVKAKKIVKTKKKIVKSVPKAKAKALPKEKVLGRVEHFFDKISVAAVSVKAPFKVGDILHIKGHTTDFFERLESMQIEHQSVQSVKKGDDVGIKVKDFVRQHDFVYLGSEKDLTAKPVQTAQKALAVQQPMFSDVKPITKPTTVAPASPAPKPKEQGKPATYSDKKFFSF